MLIIARFLCTIYFNFSKTKVFSFGEYINAEYATWCMKKKNDYILRVGKTVPICEQHIKICTHYTVIKNIINETQLGKKTISLCTAIDAEVR